MLWLHWCETTSVPHSHNSPPFSTGSDEGNTSIFLVCLGFVWYVFLILSAGLPTFLQSASIQQSQTESLQIPSYMDAAKKHVFLMWLLLARNKDHRPWQFSSNPGLKNSGLMLPLENSPLGRCYRAWNSRVLKEQPYLIIFVLATEFFCEEFTKFFFLLLLGVGRAEIIRWSPC